MAHIGITRLFDRVIVDVDDVVEHAHRRGDGLLQLDVIDATVFEVLSQIDRTQIADCGFGLAGVEGDFGAQVARMHNADMLLWRAHVASVLERDPGVPGLEQHGQHLAPEVGRLDCLEWLDFTTGSFFFVGNVGLLKGCAKFVVQVGHVVG